jgi:hypothetical protein
MEWKQLIRPAQLERLMINHRINEPLKGSSREQDFVPVCRLFNPLGTGTWILSECDEDGLAFGLADIGSPELGYIAMQELWELRLPHGMRIEEDRHWTAVQRLSQYADAARAGHRI